MRLDQLELEKFSHLRGIIGQTKAMKRSSEVDINNQGFTDEEYEQLEGIKKKKKRQGDHALTPEEADLLVQEELKKKQRNIAISILRGISIRMPMLLYGANIEDEDKEITIDNFTSLVDDISWDEFMPRGVTKELFDEFKRYYDPDIFAASGKRIREQARYADSLDIEARIDQIATIFGTFRNPDKETVLTPWRVVNMQLGDTLGGWVFYDEEYKERLTMPREVRHSGVTDSVFRPDAKILEINSKSGLYPLYMAYGIYRNRIEAERMDWMATEANDESRLKHHQRIWDEVLRQNIFVVCKTPMARCITIRTLAGFRPKVKVNAHAFNDLVMQIQQKSGQLITKLSSPYFWRINSDELMKFNAIVGNPPYQLMGGSGGTNDAPIYQLFCDTAIRLKPHYISLITPARWFSGGRENLLGEFRKHMLSCGHLKMMSAFAKSQDVFPSVSIEGGICYFLYSTQYLGNCDYSFYDSDRVSNTIVNLNQLNILIRDPQLNAIVRKVEQIRKQDKMDCVDSIISADTPFGIPTNPGKSTKTPFDIFEESTEEHNTKVYYLESNKRRIAYCRRTDVKKNCQDIDRHKVFIPKARGFDGYPSLVLGLPEIEGQNSVCSQTFIYAAFDTYEEASNFAKYIATRFLRVIVSSVKITQDALSGAYRFVPLQDFTSSSDIDWSAPIEDIDSQLYKKYNLSDEEISFIEKTIKPMG